MQAGAPYGSAFSPAPPPLAAVPVGSPGFPGAPPYRPQLARTIINVGVPTGGLIAAGIATALALGYNVFQNPALAVLGGVLAGGVSVLVVLAYLWLDRWEPEPPRLLLFAWLWGGIAVVFSLLTSLFDTDVFVSSVIRAPIVEELAKGAFLVLMLTGLRRREVNTLTDCIVYAGMVGAAFGFIENVLYIARGGTLIDSLVVAAVRLPTPFLHPFFTTVTAIGLYVGLTKTTRAARWGFLGLGYAGAVVLHMIWNATGLAAHALLFLPLFGGAVALAIVTRNREQRVLLAHLPGIVASGLIRPEEAAWLATMQGRKVWRTHAGEFHGPQARKDVEHVAGAVTEIAFVRERIDRGTSDPNTYARLEELTATILGQPHPPVPPGPAPVPASVPPPAQPAVQQTGWSPIPGQALPPQPYAQPHAGGLLPHPPTPGQEMNRQQQYGPQAAGPNPYRPQAAGPQPYGAQGPGPQQAAPPYPGSGGGWQPSGLPYGAGSQPAPGPNPDGMHQVGPDPSGAVPGAWSGWQPSAASATEPTIAVGLQGAQPPYPGGSPDPGMHRSGGSSDISHDGSGAAVAEGSGPLASDSKSESSDDGSAPQGGTRSW